MLSCSILIWVFSAPQSSKTHIGIHMYKGFNIDSNGFYNFTPYLRDNTLGHFQEGIDIGSKLAQKFPHFKSINNFWLQKAFYFIYSNPLQTIKLIFLKFYNSFFFIDWNDTVEIQHLKSYSFLHKYCFLSFSFLVPFAFIGIYYTFKHHRKNSYRILLIFLSIPLISILITCLTNRYQAQLIPVLSIYSGLGCSFIYDSLKRNNIKNIIFLMIVIIILLAIPYLSSKQSYQPEERLKFLKYKLNNNSEANIFYIPFIKNERNLSFIELKQTYENFIKAENTIDAIGLIKKYSSTFATENEKVWLLEALGNAYFEEKFYENSIICYKKILDIKYCDEIYKKLKNAQYLNFLKYSIDSYP